MDITQALTRHALQRPDHPAIEDGGRVLGYAELEARVDWAAANLQAAGVAPGDVVAVMLPDSCDHLIVLLALARTGAVTVAIDAALPEPERLQLARIAPAVLIVATAGEPAIGGVPALPLAAVLGPPAAVFRRPALGADHPLTIVESSGTTGTPKRFVWSHARMWEQVLRHRRCLGLGWRDRYLALVRMPFFWQRELCFVLLGLGATIVVGRWGAPDQVAAQVEGGRITMLALVPWHLAQLLEHPGGPEPRFPALRVLLVGSAPLAHARRLQVRRRLTPNLYEQLGTNEAGLLVLGSPADQDACPGAIGRVAAGVEAQVVDAQGRTLPPGEIGLAGFRGAGFPAGYVGDPDATARAFRGGWFYPGDLACIDADGYFHFKGRADDVINNSGSKFYPIEVETALLEHPAVVEAAVLGWPHDRLGEAAAAILVVRSPVAGADLAEHCLRRVAGYKVPHWFFTLDQMPKTAGGKIMKRRLRAMLGEQLSRPPAAAAAAADGSGQPPPDRGSAPDGS